MSLMRSSSETSQMSGLLSQQLKGIPEGQSRGASRAASHHLGSEANSGHSSDDCGYVVDENPMFNMANGNANLHSSHIKKVRVQSSDAYPEGDYLASLVQLAVLCGVC